MSGDPALIPFETALRAGRSAAESVRASSPMQAEAWLQWCADLRGVMESLRPPCDSVGGQIRAALQPANPCSGCGGSGERFNPGHYVPGERFVEPPFVERCEDCMGTGFGEVAIRLSALETRVEQLEAESRVSRDLDPAREDEDLRELAARAAVYVARGERVLVEDGQALLDLIARREAT